MIAVSQRTVKGVLLIYIHIFFNLLSLFLLKAKFHNHLSENRLSDDIN